MAEARFDVLSIGDAILDVVTPPLSVPSPGDRQSRVPGFAHLPGGNATNFALASAALRGRAAFVGCVGRDPAGKRLRAAYRSARVAVALRTSAKGTGTTLAITYADGTRHLVTAIGANADLRASDVPKTWPAATRHVHRAGYWWTPRLQGAPSARIFREARSHGATTSLDVATEPEGWPEGRRHSVLGLLPLVDTFFGNDEEVCALAGLGNPLRAARTLCRRGVREVVLHRGPAGAVRVGGSRTTSAAAFPVREDNPTGCGDVFNAGYVHARLAGSDVPSSLRFANAAAALHLSDRRRPYPTAGQVARFLHEHRP